MPKPETTPPQCSDTNERYHYQQEPVASLSASQTTNVISLNMTDGRREVWTFPDGTVVTMEVPATEPPITVKHAVYCMSAIIHQVHKAMSNE